MGERRGMGWEGRKRRGEWEGGGRGEDVEGPGKWSAPGPVLALGGPGLTVHKWSSIRVLTGSNVA